MKILECPESTVAKKVSALLDSLPDGERLNVLRGLLDEYCYQCGGQAPCKLPYPNCNVLCGMCNKPWEP